MKLLTSLPYPEHDREDFFLPYKKVRSMITKTFFCIYFQSEEIFLDMFEDEYQAVRRGETYACKKWDRFLL